MSLPSLPGAAWEARGARESALFRLATFAAPSPWVGWGAQNAVKPDSHGSCGVYLRRVTFPSLSMGGCRHLPLDPSQNVTL